MQNLHLVIAVFAILIGGIFLLTPDGIVVIVENPILRYAVGLAGIALGIGGIAAARR